MANFQRIKSIRHLLDVSTTSSLCVTLCMSHLNYATALLHGLSDATLNKMQRVQNICAKLTLRKRQPQTVSLPIALVTNKVIDRFQDPDAYL